MIAAIKLCIMIAVFQYMRGCHKEKGISQFFKALESRIRSNGDERLLKRYPPRINENINDNVPDNENS